MWRNSRHQTTNAENFEESLSNFVIDILIVPSDYVPSDKDNWAVAASFEIVWLI